MAGAWQQGVRQLLRQSRTAFLATDGEHGPETSMAPFAFYQGNLLLHLSSLARHSKNILQHPDIGVMICTPEIAGQSPLALPRLSLQGRVEGVSDAMFAACKAAYVARIADAEPLFDFADFRLFQFEPNRIQWVGGFGAARKITLEGWYELQT